MSWSDYWPVYLDNLSTAYMFSVLIAVFALFVAHFYQNKEPMEEEEEESSLIRPDSNETIANDNKDDEESGDEKFPYLKGEFGGAFGKIKEAKQEALKKIIQNGETEDQKVKERQAEQEQLKAIFELLQKQEEKFKISSEEQLADQLRLYRR